MEQRKLPVLHELLRVPVGSVRYGYCCNHSDRDVFILTPETDMQVHDPETDTACFVWSVPMLRTCWGHPLLLGNLTGTCIGNTRLCAFLSEHKRELAYAAPERTALFGLEYIAQGEYSGYDSPIKAGLRTAIILSHMAKEIEDPFSLDDEEKAILARARTGDVPAEERVELYRRTISPETIDRLMKMPDHPTVKHELFQLIEEETQC